MPIVFIHGAGNRKSDPDYESGWAETRGLLVRYVAPVIADDPEKVQIIRAVWGDLGAPLAWKGASRPKTAIRGAGAEDAPDQLSRAIASAKLLSSEPAVTGAHSTTEGTASDLVVGGISTGKPSSKTIQLTSLSDDDLSDLAAVIIDEQDANRKPEERLAPAEKALLLLIADEVAHDPQARARIGRRPDNEVAEFQAIMTELYTARAAGIGSVVAMGPLDFLTGIGERLGAALNHAANLPGYLASRVVMEARPTLQDMVINLLGDPFYYLRGRGNAANPGKIPMRILSYLVEAHKNQQDRNGEPLVVLSHSQGGQIMYDMVSSFLPSNIEYQGVRARDIRVDFWAAAASQVAFFEELKLFLKPTSQYGSDFGNKAPFPGSNLGTWWNVWDQNDFVSFTAADIFEGLDDFEFDCHMSSLDAHGAYIRLPSFFKAFAERLVEAKTENWGRQT